MQFITWVTKQGGAVALSKKLNVTSASVRTWLRGESVPRLGTMREIYKLSHGKISYADILKSIERTNKRKS